MKPSGGVRQFFRSSACSNVFILGVRTSWTSKRSSCVTMDANPAFPPSPNSPSCAHVWPSWPREWELDHILHYATVLVGNWLSSVCFSKQQKQPNFLNLTNESVLHFSIQRSSDLLLFFNAGFKFILFLFSLCSHVLTAMCVYKCVGVAASVCTHIKAQGWCWVILDHPSILVFEVGSLS